MTTIDTTLYANGALRLSRHGAGKGGNVLMRLGANGEIAEQVEITDEGCDRLDQIVANFNRSYGPIATPQRAFNHVANWFAARA